MGVSRQWAGSRLVHPGDTLYPLAVTDTCEELSSSCRDVNDERNSEEHSIQPSRIVRCDCDRGGTGYADCCLSLAERCTSSSALDCLVLRPRGPSDSDDVWYPNLAFCWPTSCSTALRFRLCAVARCARTSTQSAPAVCLLGAFRLAEACFIVCLGVRSPYPGRRVAECCVAAGHFLCSRLPGGPVGWIGRPAALRYWQNPHAFLKAPRWLCAPGTYALAYRHGVP